MAQLALGFFSPDLPVYAIMWALMQHLQLFQSQPHVQDFAPSGQDDRCKCLVDACEHE